MIREGQYCCHFYGPQGGVCHKDTTYSRLPQLFHSRGKNLSCASLDLFHAATVTGA